MVKLRALMVDKGFAEGAFAAGTRGGLWYHSRERECAGMQII